MNVLDPFRARDPDLVADIEAALNLAPDGEIASLRAAFDAAPNLSIFAYNSEHTIEEMIEFTSDWKARHFTRLVAEFNKIPAGAPYLLMNRLMGAMFGWVQADLNVEKCNENPL